MNKVGQHFSMRKREKCDKKVTDMICGLKK